MALLLAGIPIMWVEWAIGRYGGGFEHSTAPGVFHSLWEKNRFIKYFGVIGIFGPMVIMIYYTYIESWCLAYSFFALVQKYSGILDQSSMRAFLRGFQGLASNKYFSSIAPAYIFFLITFAVNMIVLKHGIRGGIERFCKFALPTLLNPGRPGIDFRRSGSRQADMEHFERDGVPVESRPFAAQVR